MTTKRKSRILSEIHETARGLAGAGIIGKRQLREFDALCELDTAELSPRKIKLIRERAHVSQTIFAAMLNTSVSTIQKWEIGDKKPSGPSLKLLNLIQRKGMDVVL